MARFLVRTFGCQFNELYSGAIIDALNHNGHQTAAGLSDADVVIINTCAVRRKSEEKAYGYLGEAAHAVGGAHIMFMGCVASLDVQRVHRIAGRDVHLISGDASLEQVLQTLSHIVHLEVQEYSPPSSLFPTADIEIIRGCESFCTYCIVPASRGREIAVPAEDVVANARKALADGFAEILLLGQNINHYAWREESFMDLLETIDLLPGVFWTWFLSPHPASFDEHDVERMMQLKHAEHRLHLPLQSGSNRILAAMNRRYSTDTYARLASLVRRDASWALTSDVIVGFPGETDEDFEQTVDAVKQFSFDAVFVAKYSDRPGTPATRMQNKVPQAVVDHRHARLLDVVEDLSLLAHQNTVGHTEEVLVLSPHGEEQWFGRTRSGKNVWFAAASPTSQGQFCSVAIERASREGLYGARVA
jgi:tRNA-2-methylthio-N6-dimethylallyladenosine synthase